MIKSTRQVHLYYYAPIYSYIFCRQYLKDFLGPPDPQLYLRVSYKYYEYLTSIN